MPTPATAPPKVMVLSCGTTAGMTPRARHASTSASYVTIPSASTWSLPTSRTSLKTRTSSRRRAFEARSRKRFEVSFCSPIGPLPPPDCLTCAASASFFFWKLSGVNGFLVEEIPRHRVARARDIALREHDLEEVRVARRRTEHFGAAVEVHAPDPAEALVEALGIERADAVPVPVEALGPGVERERVVPAQVLHVDDLEPRLLHFDDHIGEARDPAARKNIFSDEEIRVVPPDVPDEVNQSQAALLQQARVRADHIAELVAPRMLEAADGHHLVEFPG